MQTGGGVLGRCRGASKLLRKLRLPGPGRVCVPKTTAGGASEGAVDPSFAIPGTTGRSPGAPVDLC